MAYYRTCPFCGCNNDPGETCDCRQEKKGGAAPLQPERPQAKIPTASLPVWPAKVKERGLANG